MKEDQLSRLRIYPGEVLADEFVEVSVTPTELSRQIGFPPNPVSQIIRGKRAITGNTALRFGHLFKSSPEFRLNLQTACDPRVATKKVGRSKAKLPMRRETRGEGLRWLRMLDSPRVSARMDFLPARFES